MAHYCVGDLYGRYDLFEMILENLKLKSKKDSVYLLGNVLGTYSGGFQILKHLTSQPKTFHLIRGAYEERFLSQYETLYRPILSNETLKNGLKSILQPSTKAVLEIQKTIFLALADFLDYEGDSSLQAFLTNYPTIETWAKRHKTRRTTLDAIVNFFEAYAYTIEDLLLAQELLNSSFDSFDDKALKEEVLTLTLEEVETFVTYLQQAPTSQSLKVNKQHFFLQSQLTEETIKEVTQTSKEKKSVYFVYGHTPVVNIHTSVRSIYDFNYREILSFTNGKHQFYNLNLAKHSVGVLRLDDLEEFYAMNLLHPNEQAKQTPTTPVKTRKVKPQTLPTTDETIHQFVSFQNYGLEYFIEVNENENKLTVIEFEQICHQPRTKAIRYELPLPNKKKSDDALLSYVRKQLPLTKAAQLIADQKQMPKRGLFKKLRKAQPNEETINS